MLERRPSLDRWRAQQARRPKGLSSSPLTNDFRSLHVWDIATESLLRLVRLPAVARGVKALAMAWTGPEGRKVGVILNDTLILSSLKIACALCQDGKLRLIDIENAQQWGELGSACICISVQLRITQGVAPQPPSSISLQSAPMAGMGSNCGLGKSNWRQISCRTSV